MLVLYNPKICTIRNYFIKHFVSRLNQDEFIKFPLINYITQITVQDKSIQTFAYLSLLLLIEYTYSNSNLHSTRD